MTEKTAWEPYSLGIRQRQPRMLGDVVCLKPGEFHSSLAEWPERARLICAAPDLLAACELALEWSRPVPENTRPLMWTLDVQPLMEDAVARATGANKPSEPDLCCAETPAEDPTPAQKQFVVMAQTGERLFFMAQSVEEYDGGLGFYVGTNMVGLVAAGRWTAYWLNDDA